MRVRIDRIALIVLVIAWAHGLAGQTEDGAGIVYGNDYVFSIQAPDGWILDNGAGRAQGLCAVLYEKGSSWAAATTVMYANAASKHVDGQRTREELIAYDVEQFRKRAPGLKVTSLPGIETGTGTASIRRFEGDEHGNYEAVAYIEEKNTTVMLILSSRTEAGFTMAYPAFEKLVRSYHFLTSDVRIQK